MKLTILVKEDILGYIILKDYQIYEDLSIILLKEQRQRIQRLKKRYKDNSTIRLENENGTSVWFPFTTTDYFHWYLGD